MLNVDKSFVENLFSIKDKVSIVTGATGALGGAVAAGYAQAGSKVVLTARNEAKLKALSDEIKGAGCQCTYVVADPSNEADVDKIIKTAVDTYGQLDILCVCHGYNAPKSVLEQTVEEWQKIMDADLKSVYIVTKKAGEQMVKQGNGGSIVMTSSARSQRGMKGYTGYCASKGGTDIMAQALACDLGEHGINVNTFNPTVFRSDLTEWMFQDDAVYQNFLKRIPIGRLGEPEDFVGTAIFLASKGANFITGANLPVDGGYWGN